MLPKNKRLQRSLVKQLTGGKTFSSEHFTLKLWNTPHSKTRFAISVSKKVEAHAVDRNRVRRRCYSALHKLWLRIITGRSGLFMTKKGISRLKFEEIKKEIAQLLKSAHAM